VLVGPEVMDPTSKRSFEMIAQENPWLLTEKLVVKPDQLIKRRGKAGLLAVNKTWPEVQAWISERMNKEVQVEQVKGVLNHFIVEAFVPHKQDEEYYYCIMVRTSGGGASCDDMLSDQRAMMEGPLESLASVP
jgi:ATP citrate (pro-S)-lyase